jgi:hypothetical protein
VTPEAQGAGDRGVGARRVEQRIDRDPSMTSCRVSGAIRRSSTSGSSEAETAGVLSDIMFEHTSLSFESDAEEQALRERLAAAIEARRLGAG